MENPIVKTHTVKIAGREFTLAFTLRAMLKLQEKISDFDFNNVDKIISTPQGMLDTLYVLAENGEKLSGRELDVDEDWFALHIPATLRRVVGIQIAVTQTLADGMTMEAEAEDEQDREVDLVLKEIQKKREKTNSPTEKSQPGD